MTTPVHGRTTRPTGSLDRWLLTTLLGALMAMIPTGVDVNRVGLLALVMGGLGMIVTLARA